MDRKGIKVMKSIHLQKIQEQSQKKADGKQMIPKSKILNKVHKYLKKWQDKLSIAISLTVFATTHGEDKVQNMYHFIVCFEQLPKSKPSEHTSMIRSTLMHDLGIAGNPQACPRTSTYTETYVKNFLNKMNSITNKKDGKNGK
jgi:hypothetical protein